MAKRKNRSGAPLDVKAYERLWRDVMSRASNEGFAALGPKDHEAIIRYWEMWPIWQSAGDSLALVDLLLAQHALESLAEREGLDSAPLARAREVYHTWAARAIERAKFQRLDPSTWPIGRNFLAFLPKRGGPSKEERLAFRESENLLGRLRARLRLGAAQSPAIPADTVSAWQALKGWRVSRATLQRYRKDGALKGHRRAGAKRNSPYRYSRSDLDRLFERKQPPVETQAGR